MRVNTKCDDIDIMELVVLPMANLKVSLEAILNGQQDITPDELLCGLRVVHQNASSIIQNLTPAQADPTQEMSTRSIPNILKAFSDERAAMEGYLESAT